MGGWRKAKVLLSAAVDRTFLCVSGFQESFTQQRRKTGRRRTPTSTRLSRATTPSTAHEPSQPSNTCCSAKSCSTCKCSGPYQWTQACTNHVVAFCLCSPVDRDCVCYRPEDVQALISGKLALRYAGRQVSHFIANNLSSDLNFTDHC